MRKLFVCFFVFTGVISVTQCQDIVRKNGVRPLICGHRGGFYDQFPENSFAAINHTVRHCKSSPVVIEIDIRASRDGTLFILHDESVDRTTTGKGSIAELSDDQLKSFFLKNRDGSLTTEKIPTFDSLVSYIKGRNVVLMLDIKADVWEQVLKKVAEEKIVYKCIVLTFNPADSKNVFQLLPTVKISCLVRSSADWALIRELSIPPENLIAYINTTTPQNIVSQLKNHLAMVMTDMGEERGEK